MNTEKTLYVHTAGRIAEPLRPMEEPDPQYGDPGRPEEEQAGESQPPIEER